MIIMIIMIMIMIMIIIFPPLLPTLWLSLREVPSPSSPPLPWHLTTLSSTTCNYCIFNIFVFCSTNPPPPPLHLTTLCFNIFKPLFFFPPPFLILCYTPAILFSSSHCFFSSSFCLKLSIWNHLLYQSCCHCVLFSVLIILWWFIKLYIWFRWTNVHGVPR